MKLWFPALIGALITCSAFAQGGKDKHLYVDAIEPTHTCDRLLDPKQKDRCVATLKRPTADSYLSSVCERQDEDAAFFECIDLADKYHFDPRKIQPCGGEDLNDQARIQCLQQAGRLWKAPTNDPEPLRYPASSSAKKHKVVHGKASKKAAHHKKKRKAKKTATGSSDR